MYVVTHSVCMTTEALCVTWNPLNLPSYPLYMSSQPLCWGHHTHCVSHHRSHMYCIICVVHDVISTLYDHNPKYLWNQIHYIHYITRIIYDISSTLYDFTFTMCVTSHNGSIYDIKHYVYDIITWYGITHMLWPHIHCVPSQPLCLTLHSVYFWHDTQCTNFMKRS